MRDVSKAVAVLVAVVSWSGCGGSTPKPTGKDPGRAVLAPGASVVDEGTLGELSSVEEDGAWVFSRTTPLLQGVAVGNVLIAGPSPHLPYGALVRVEAVELRGAGVVLQTRPASLAEGFEELVVHLETTLDATGLQKNVAPGIHQDRKALGLNFPFRLSEESDGGANKLELQGAFSLDPSFSLKIDIDFSAFELKELGMRFGAKETLVADFVGKGNQPIEERLTLGTIWFTPIILMVPIPLPPGVVPVVLTPRLAIEAGLAGRVQGEMTASLKQSASFQAAIGYANGTFRAEADTDSNYDPEQPEYQGSANVKATVGPQLAVLIYGAVGPFAGVDAFVDLHASLQGPPPCATGTLDAGLTGKAGVDFIAKYETTLFDERFPLASFDSCTTDPGAPGAPRPAITWARSFGRVGSMGETAKAVVQARDGSYLVVGDSTLFQGTQSFGAATWALRLDALGNVVWQRAFGKIPSVGLTQGAQEVPDGFLVAGTSGVMKIDSGGNPVWARTYAPLEIGSIAAFDDGSFLLAGRQPIQRASWALKLDREGAVVWSRRYAGEVLSRVRTTSDGGAILLGNGGSSPMLLKVDGGGEVEWQRGIDNSFDAATGGDGDPWIAPSNEYAFDVAEKPGGGYVVVGRGYGNFPIPEPGPVGFFAPTVFELAPDGELASATIHRVPSDGSFGAAFAVGVRPSGSPVIVGRYVDSEAALSKREDLLILQGGAFHALGGAMNDAVYSETLPGIGHGAPLAMTGDGGAVVVATSDSFGDGGQFWVVKLNRTAGIDFEYRSAIAGSSLENPNARTTPGFAPSSAMPATADLVTTVLPTEETAFVVGRQTP